MKKILMILFAVLVALTCCKKQEAEKKTVLFIGTPYQGYPEMIKGSVKQVIEKSYWALPDGETFKKGNPITMKDRDSLAWTRDYLALFDEAGDLVSCIEMDENGKTLSRTEMIKENGVPGRINYTENDTMRMYSKLTYDNEMNIVEIKNYSGIKDTLVGAVKLTYSHLKDTVKYQGFNYKGVKGGWQEYIYENGLFKMHEFYNRDGNFLGAMHAIYNEKGKMSELRFIDKDRKEGEYNTITYEYDDKGNWTKAILADSKGRHFIEERTYVYY